MLVRSILKSEGSEQAVFLYEEIFKKGARVKRTKIFRPTLGISTYFWQNTA